MDIAMYVKVYITLYTKISLETNQGLKYSVKEVVLCKFS